MNADTKNESNQPQPVPDLNRNGANAGKAARPAAKGVAGAVWLGALALGAASIAGFAGRVWWVLDLTNHFRVQYFYGLLAAGLALAYFRQWRQVGLVAALAMLNLALICPFYFFETSRPTDTAGRTRVRALSLNLLSGNRQYTAVRDLVREVQPDVIVFLEFNDEWDEQLAELRTEFPHTHLVPRTGNFGIAMFSRIPFHAVRTDFLSNGNPVIVAEMHGSPSTWTLMAAHAFPPVSSQAAALRNRQLQQLAGLVRPDTTPVVVLGDLNITPWSPYFGELLDAAGLHDSRRGFGVQPSWPAGNRLLRIPIDHCLASRSIIVRRRDVGRDVGSDHLPVIVEFTIREQ